MNTILSVGVIFLASVLAARILNKIHLPAVTAYLLLGVILGGSFLNVVSGSILAASGLISNVVLGFIAFSIGRNFSFESFRKIGSSVLWISILEAMGAWILVTLIFLALKKPFHIAILFGAISAATAPAATVMIIREYKAKGNFTNTLLGVVAIDDAWCLIIFAISLALSKAIYVRQTVSNLFYIKVILSAGAEIFGAFILGSLTALLMTKAKRFIKSRTEFLIYSIGFVFFNAGLAIGFNFSVLLANMFFGAVLVNIDHESFKFYDVISTVDPPLYMLFFVLAGANMEIGLLKNIGITGVAYIIYRVIGKALGSYLGGHISGAPDNIKKYIGLGLVPQAGVALGCALVVRSDFPQAGPVIFTTILATTIIYEIVGPVCTKIALEKVGEITRFETKPENKDITGGNC
ncbi:MAG: Sodium/hydrogen exchanger family protein [Elusimicrobia bacterium ADurb.Bin231]|nr:MAG: Sodium/hydrogen exchanger family protein [Elusimicrobia bacterium ADurb.Bin231]